MKSRIGSFLIKIAAGAAAGWVLRFAVDLRPVWWLVWLAPVPLLVIALRFTRREAQWMVPLACAVGASADFHYFRLVMPLPAVLAAIALQTLLWTFLIFATQRVVVRTQAWWTVFVYPVLWVAADTLMAALLPDGNWGSLAYSQGDRLAVVQVASLFGTAGVLFLLALVPSTLGIALGGKLRRGWIAYGVTTALVLAALGYGEWRLRQPVTGVQTTFGIVSIDDPIGVRASAEYAEKILGEYDRRVAEVVAQGAQVVVLPEKIGVFTPARAQDEQHALSKAARANRVWLEAGVGIDDGQRPTNWAWLFAPDGALAASYEKHHMAPPERREHYAVGADYTVQTIGERKYGLAVCKDMHFAALGREYGRRGADTMLVPAWDFAYLDGWIEARTTVFRGIENGYTIVRASREGLLTVSDPYGRVLAETASSEMPGRTLVVRTAVAAQVRTLYTRIGNVLGWVCVAAGAGFVGMGRGKKAASSS